MPTNMPPKPAMPASASSGPGKLLLGLVCLVVGFAGGYGFGRVSTGTPVNPLVMTKGGSYQDGYDAAKKLVEESGIFAPSPTEATAITGTITAIDGGVLTLQAAPLTSNPLAQLGPETRKVTTSSTTAFFRIDQLSPEEFQKALARQASAEAGEAPEPFSPSTRTAIALEELKVGDVVTVMADHDVLKADSFEATEIDLAAPSAPPAPPIPPPAP